MQTPRVTFIIATYRRVDALHSTLRSLQLQTCQQWEAIVVGDCCGPETGAMLHTLADDRIRYYNFPERFGEQSGPNSFGLHLATGDFVCFLNHDDLLLADHLDYALGQIAAAGADFYIGQAANGYQLAADASGAIMPVFTSVLPLQPDLVDLIKEDDYAFDPSSFWLVRRAYARKVGSWQHSSRLWRTPLRHWIMRAWRLGGVFSFGDRVTGLRFWTQNVRASTALYDVVTTEHQYMIKMMETRSVHDVHAFIAQQLQEAASKQGPTRRKKSIGTRRALQKALFLHLGIDHLVVRSWFSRRDKGGLHKTLLQKRTGESISQPMDIDSLLKNPEALRVL